MFLVSKRKNAIVARFLLGSQITGYCAAIKILQIFITWKKIWQTEPSLKTRDYHFVARSYIEIKLWFSAVGVWLRADHKEGWAQELMLSNCDSLEETLEDPWTAMRSSRRPKGNQPWVSTGTTDAEAALLATWWKSQLKKLDAGKKDWAAEDEMG